MWCVKSPHSLLKHSPSNKHRAMKTSDRISLASSRQRSVGRTQARAPSNHTGYNTALRFQNGVQSKNLHSRCVFAIFIGGSQHPSVPGIPTKTRASVVWCQGSQPKHARLWYGAKDPDQNTCVCGMVPGTPTKTRLESRSCDHEVNPR